LIEILLLTGMALSRASSPPQFDRIPNVGASLLAKRPSGSAQFFDLNEAV
jgi:hypothetical protein